VLFAGLYASLSRGPWMGAMVLVVVFLATGPLAGVRYAKIALAAVLAAVLLPLAPGSDKLVDMLPFIGTVDAGNVTYRQQLLDMALPVMAQNLLFGSFTSASSPALEALRQGQGIIDVVNTYIGVGLHTGVVGLSLFVGFFVVVALALLGAMRTERDRASEEYLLGRALLATLLGILVTIFTASSITVIPVIYWTVGGLAVGYARLMADRAARRAPRRAIFRPWFAQ
jgi:O-antigen ligase